MIALLRRYEYVNSYREIMDKRTNDLQSSM